jgi:hypothetical protein
LIAHRAPPEIAHRTNLCSRSRTKTDVKHARTSRQSPGQVLRVSRLAADGWPLAMARRRSVPRRPWRPYAAVT